MFERGYSGPAVLRVTFVCADCGETLVLKSGTAQLGPKHDPLEIGPARNFHVCPCPNCIRIATEPAIALKKALDAIKGIA